MRKRLESMPPSTSRVYTGIPGVSQSNVLQSRVAQPSRGIPGASRLLAEQTTATGIFRPSLQKPIVSREDPGVNARVDAAGSSDHMAEVLDLSKKMGTGEKAEEKKGDFCRV